MTSVSIRYMSVAGTELLLIVAVGVNDICFPGAFTAPTDAVSAESLIQGYQQVIRRVHQKRIRVLMTTIPPFLLTRQISTHAGN
jgi:lysophospholipase L1-like esterase